MPYTLRQRRAEIDDRAVGASARSHYIFVHSRVRELVNLQEVGGKAKPYQIRQLLELVERYNLDLESEDD
jgi:hypothetical protein